MIKIVGFTNLSDMLQAVFGKRVYYFEQISTIFLARSPEKWCKFKQAVGIQTNNQQISVKEYIVHQQIQTEALWSFDINITNRNWQYDKPIGGLAMKVITWAWWRSSDGLYKQSPQHSFASHQLLQCAASGSL